MWAYYDCPWEFTATAAVDVVELVPATNKPIVITAIIIKQTTEIQEAQEEQLEVEIQRGGTAITSGSGGSSAAAGLKKTPGLPTSGFTFEAGNTTLATFTGGETPFRDVFPVRIGLERLFPPEEWIGCHAGNGGMVVRLPNAPADSIDFKGNVTVAEWI